MDRLGERLRGFAQPWELACFLFVPTLVVAYAASYELRNTRTLGDLPIFRTAARAVLGGNSPYPAATPHALSNFNTFVYPPAAAYVFSPLALLPSTAAQVAMVVLSLGSVVLALRFLDVRDWRCYGVAYVSAPVMSSLALGAFSLFLLLGASAAWRYRDRATAGGAAAALTATLKLFLWPLGVWLLVTRRARAAVSFVVTVCVLVVGGWAGIAFAGFRSYPHLMRVLSNVESYRGFSVVALLRLSGRATTVASVLLSVAVVAAVVLAARKGDGGRRAFAVAILGGLLASPLVWMHYYALLFVPIALYRPRFSALWLAPLALWLNPSTYSDGVAWRILLGLGLVGLVGAVAVGWNPPDTKRYGGGLGRDRSRGSGGSGYPPSPERLLDEGV